MANLLGKADTALFQGALAIGEAGVPGDMSQIYKQRAKTIKTFTEGLQQAWDKRSKEEDAEHQWLEDSRDEILGNVTTGKTNAANMALTDYVTKDMKVRLKNTKKGSLEYKKIQSEAGRLVAITKRNNEIFKNLMNEKFLARGSGQQKSLWIAMLKDYNNDGNETNVQYNGDGDYIYTLPGTDFKMTLGEIDAEIGKLDTTGPSNVYNALIKLKGNVNKRGWDDSYAIDLRNEISSSLDTPNDRKNIMHHDGFPGMKFSFYEGLTGKNKGMQEQIFDILDEIGTLDIDGVGGADTREELLTYANPKNGYLLTRAIADSPQGKQILEDFIIENLAGDIYKQGEKEINFQKSKERRGRSSGYIKSSKDPKVFSLPWGDYPLPKGVSETRDARNVTEILNEKEGGIFTIDDEEFTFSELTGTFRKTATKKAGKGWANLKTPSKVRLSKTQMIDRYGGAYKNIPSSYDATELNKRTFSGFGINLGTTKTAKDYLKNIKWHAPLLIQ